MPLLGESSSSETRSRLSDRDRHLQLLVRVALVDAARRRHVGVVAADGDTDVPLGLLRIVRRVEREPAPVADVDVDPRVRLALSTVSRLVEIAADVARREPPRRRARG
jgi:hypothetical protein